MEWLWFLALIPGIPAAWAVWKVSSWWVDSGLPEFPEKEIGIHWLPHIQEAYAEIQGLETPKCFCQECGDEGAYIDFQPKKFRVCDTCGDAPGRGGAIDASAYGTTYTCGKCLAPSRSEGVSGSSLNRENSLSAAQYNTYLQDRQKYEQKVRRETELQKRMEPVKRTTSKYVIEGPFIEIDYENISSYVDCVEVSAGSGILVVFKKIDTLLVERFLLPLWQDEVDFVVNFRPDTNSPVGPTNPEYSATCILLDRPVEGTEISLGVKGDIHRTTGKPPQLGPAKTYNNGTIVDHYAQCAVCHRQPLDTRYFKLPGDDNLYVACSGCMDVVVDMRRNKYLEMGYQGAV